LEIKEAVEKFFDVDVKKVRTALVPGKLRRLALGRPQGRRPEWKKAIITLAEGQKINLEPEVK
jgi:large subunit ribosomal protein L23